MFETFSHSFLAVIISVCKVRGKTGGGQSLHVVIFRFRGIARARVHIIYAAVGMRPFLCHDDFFMKKVAKTLAGSKNRRTFASAIEKRHRL